VDAKQERWPVRIRDLLCLSVALLASLAVDGVCAVEPTPTQKTLPLDQLSRSNDTSSRKKFMALYGEPRTVIPCMMPFITSQFQPRAPGDRPPVVPPGSANLAFIGQFCEVPFDCVFTVEYSVRSAQMAVYKLLDLDLEVPPFNKAIHDPKVLLNAVKAIFSCGGFGIRRINDAWLVSDSRAAGFRPVGGAGESARDPRHGHGK
jgi:hypothetical protein